MAFYLSFQNPNGVVQDADLQAFIQDFQAQISNDFAPVWGVEATVDSGGTGWPITIKDYPGQSDPPGALGYHAIDPQTSLPFGVIFAQLASDSGVSWTTVASHEGLEILGDPLIDSVVFIDTSGGYGLTGFLYAQEVCDACEALSYPGSINRKLLSDFVFPRWFTPGYLGQVDQMGVVPGPLQLASGGYIGYDQIYSASGWQDAIATKKPALSATNIQSLAGRAKPPKKG